MQFSSHLNVSLCMGFLLFNDSVKLKGIKGVSTKATLQKHCQMSFKRMVYQNLLKIVYHLFGEKKT